MTLSRRTARAVLAVACFMTGLLSAQAGAVYWSRAQHPDDRVLQRADLDGTNIETVAEGDTTGIAVDSVDRKVYFGHYSPARQLNTIRRANLNGSNQVILYELYGINPYSIALDRNRGKIYVSLSFFEGCVGILRFDMYGSGNIGDGTTIVDGCVSGVAVDPAAGKLYWAESSPEFAIRRANLNGSAVETVLVSDSRPIGIDIDPARGKVYWTQASENGDRVLRADFDGANQETLVSGEVNFAYGIALDLRADKVYWGWVTWEETEIRRAQLDGSNPEVVVTVRTTTEIDIDPVPDGVDVPAVSVTGSAILLLLMLGVTAAVVRKRTRAG